MPIQRESKQNSEVILKIVVWLLVAALVALHHDTWNWDNDRLIGGFLPVTLAYHMCISAAAGVVWYLATVFAWPALGNNALNESSDQARS